MNFLLFFLINFICFLLDLTLQNMKNNFINGFSAKEVEDMFHEYDTDHDDKLRIEDFIRFLLPADYVIDEKEEFPQQKV